MDTLIDAVWGDQTPVTAKGQIQICISILRRRFTDMGVPAVIVTTSQGYMLQVSWQRIDSEKFKEAVRRAQEHELSGRLELAVAAYQEGLALWRGPALDGLQSPRLDVAANKLDEMRLAALESCVELQVRTGQHVQINGLLADLVQEHPFRERLWACRMVTLSRAGRQAEALEAYRAVRSMFVSDLGVEPGPELRRLEREILAGEIVALDGPQGPSLAITTSSTPCQLPKDLSDFVGRQDELERIYAEVDTDDLAGTDILPTVTIDGPPGAGKSSLAIRAMHSVKGRFPDGQLYADLTNRDGRPVSESDVLRRFLRAFHVPQREIPESFLERVELYRSIIADRQVSVLLDNARSSAQVIPLIPPGSRCLTIITSQYRFEHIPGIHIHLGELRPEEAVEMLRRGIGAERVEADPVGAEKLANRCANLPLALRAVSSVLGSRPWLEIPVLVDRISQAENVFDELQSSGIALLQRIERSYESLPEEARSILLALSVNGIRDFNAQECATVACEDKRKAEQVLETIACANLVSRISSSRSDPEYSINRLLYAYLRRDFAVTHNARFEEWENPVKYFDHMK